MADEVKFLLDVSSVVIDLASLLVAGVVALIGINKFQTEFAASRIQREDDLRQREEDLRWRKAEAGKSLNDEMLDDPEAHAAMIMLDWSGRKFKVEADTKETITTNEMLHALRIHTHVSNQFLPKEQFIRDAFDSLFYHIGKFEHSLNTKLVEFDDIKYPMAYYATKLSENRPVFQKYLKQYGFVHGLAFLERFDSWRNAAYDRFVIRLKLGDTYIGGFDEASDLEHSSPRSETQKTSTPITLKSGVIEITAFTAWLGNLKQLKGVNTETGLRTANSLTIEVATSNRTSLRKWTYLQNSPVKYAPADLNAKGNEVLIEALELASEGIEEVPLSDESSGGMNDANSSR